MQTLVINDVDDEVIAAIEAKAAEYGISIEEQILQILNEVLLKPNAPEKNFAAALMSIPNVGDDEDFTR